MALPWKQLAALLMVLTIGLAAMTPAPASPTRSVSDRSANWYAHQPRIAENPNLRSADVAEAAAQLIDRHGHWVRSTLHLVESAQSLIQPTGLLRGGLAIVQSQLDVRNPAAERAGSARSWEWNCGYLLIPADI